MIQKITTKILQASLVLFSFIPLITTAQGGDAGLGGGGGISFPNPIKKQSIIEIVNAVLDFVTQLGAVVAVLFLVYSGFLFVLARGDPNMLSKAKSTFMWTIVGAMIVLGAFVLSEIIENTAKNFGVGS